MAESYTWNEGGDNLGLESWAKVWVSPKGLSQAQGSEVGIHTLPPLIPDPVIPLPTTLQKTQAMTPSSLFKSLHPCKISVDARRERPPESGMPWKLSTSPEAYTNTESDPTEASSHGQSQGRGVPSEQWVISTERQGC